MLDDQIKHNTLNLQCLSLIHLRHIITRLVAICLIFANYSIYFVNQPLRIRRIFKLHLFNLLLGLLYPLHLTDVGHMLQQRLLKITLLHSHSRQELFDDFLEAVFVVDRESTMLFTTLLNIRSLIVIFVKLSSVFCVVVLLFKDKDLIPNHGSPVELKEDIKFQSGLLGRLN